MNPDDTSQDQQLADVKDPVKYSGMSGNEMYCANLLGYKVGDLLVGNSVFAMGFIGSMDIGSCGIQPGPRTLNTAISNILRN